jgi:hypothetical protein
MDAITQYAGRRERIHAGVRSSDTIEGKATLVTATSTVVLTAGMEAVVARGTRQRMAVTAGTRTLHVFGGKRALREGES